MSTRLLRTIVWVVLVFAALPAAHAHRDTIIRLEGAKLDGLPQEYAPAEFDAKTFRLRIGNREMTFTSHLREFFAEPYDLKITASWYHETSILPRYIVFHVQPKGKDFSYELLLNLDTLELLDLSVVLQTSESSTWQLPVRLEEHWKKDIQDSIRTLK